MALHLDIPEDMESAVARALSAYAYTLALRATSLADTGRQLENDDLIKESESYLKESEGLGFLLYDLRKQQAELDRWGPA